MPRISFDDTALNTQQNSALTNAAQIALFDMEVKRLSLIMQVVVADFALNRPPTVDPDRWAMMIAESVGGLTCMPKEFLEQKRRILIMELGFMENQMGVERTIPSKSERNSR
jgi:hypothetical protein